MARVMMEGSVEKLLGFILLVVGAALLYYGWESHAAVPPDFDASRDPRGARSVWLLSIGAVAAVWGLFALLRRRVM